MDKLLDGMRAKLKTKGYKVTPQRQKILDIIIKNEYKHLTSEEIYMLIKKECPEIGLATIYRNMQLLEKMNIVCKFDIDENGIRYELMDSRDKYQHPHFICTNCMSVFPVKDINLDSVESELNDRYKFKIANYSLKLYGICKNCSKL